MKQILQEWRKFVTESNKKTGTLNSDYPGYIELYSPYSSNNEQAQVGSPGDRVEVLGSWSDKGVKWLEVEIEGIKGWIDSTELDLIIPPEKDMTEAPIYSFDYDNTLIRYHTLEDGDVVYLGPHEENIKLTKDLAAAGNKIIIVTSRSKLKKKMPWDDAPTPEEAITEFDLPIEEIYYTYGDLKADKLTELGAVKHWDDDEEEVEAAEAAGIEAVLVPVEQGITERLRQKFVDHLDEIVKHIIQD
jgi:histidinol phosphatase-like enzyme